MKQTYNVGILCAGLDEVVVTILDEAEILECGEMG